MMHDHQTDTLSLDTAVAVSGTGGNSAPEQAAGDENYSAWSWETILATVLNTPISDRSEVTGQPWLTIVADGQPAPGGHLIWTASWSTKPKSGATSLQVYLNPALYVGGGAWDRFANAPPQALSGPAGQLPLAPPTFQAAQRALASVTTGIGKVSTNLGQLRHDTTKEDTPLQGNAAGVIAELFGDLHGVTLSIYDQLSNPSYSDAVGAAGDAATTFLGDIGSAYQAWSQQAEHSPLGAIVHVLTSIATPDGNGGYTIPDPQNTPFGDLTTPGAWDSVEQQAKNIWIGPLDGNSAAFEGLDLLGRTALSKLVGQYGTTTGTIAPVVGPASPPITQTPVGGPAGNGGPVGNGGGPGGNGGGPPTRPVVLAGAGGPGPGNGPSTALVTAGGGGQPQPAFAGAPAPAGAPAFAGAPVPAGAIPGLGAGPAVAAQPLTVPAGTAIGTATGPGLPIPGGTGPILAAMPGTDTGAGPGARAVSAGLNLPSTAGVLAGAIGATPGSAGEPARSAGAAREAGKGFTGTVGRTPQVKGHHGHHGHDGAVGPSHGSGPGRAVRTAPPAGFSLGSGSVGAVLPQSAVPVVASRPPSITSSPVNMQLTPTSADGTGLPALPGSPGVLAVAGPSAVPAPWAVAVPAGASAQAGANGPMMMPPQAQGGQGQQAQEGQRRAYLPEEDEYWGTEPLLLGPGVDAIDDEDPDEDEEFDAPRMIVGIGAEPAPTASTQTMSEWRIG